MEEKNKSQQLSKTNWIVKSNTLNEIRDNQMTPSQLRFFSIYLSKINPKDESTRLVSFKLSEYTRIMQYKQMNITRIHQTAEELLGLTATFKETDSRGRFAGMTICQIFKRFKLYKSSDEEWYVSIDCHDDVLPYMFSFRKYYFKYQLWNALRLGTPNQLRMYEILKQYEHAGAREISLCDLRSFLGIGDNEYREFANFRRRVLDSCQQALLENTDITFTYEAIKKGRGGKVTALKFEIFKNDHYIDQLTLDEFVETQDTPEISDELIEVEFENENLEFLASACENKFSESEIQVLFDIIVKVIPFDSSNRIDLERFEYLHQKYNELKLRMSRTDLKPVNSPFAWLKDKISRDLSGVLYE